MATLKYKNGDVWEELNLGGDTLVLGQSMWPTGSIYLTIGNTSPSSVIGGTWSEVDYYQFAEGSSMPTFFTLGYSNNYNIGQPIYFYYQSRQYKSFVLEPITNISYSTAFFGALNVKMYRRTA